MSFLLINGDLELTELKAEVFLWERRLWSGL